MGNQRQAAAIAAAQRSARGRPRKYSDELLVDAALRVMEREGYTALTIRSLAEELGTSHTTLYNYISAIEEIEDKAVHKLVDRLPPPHSSSGPELRTELQALLMASQKLLLQHPGVMLSKPDSAAAKSFQRIGDQWRLALRAYAPDAKTVYLALGALMSTVLLAVEAERRQGAGFSRRKRNATRPPPENSIEHYSFEQYLDAMIDFVLPGLTSVSPVRKAVHRRSAR